MRRNGRKLWLLIRPSRRNTPSPGLVGIDYIGIGTDFDGGGGVTGCNDVGEMYRVTMELLRRGYTEPQIAKIWSGNTMRVLQKVIDQAIKS
jgi:membrane dipeptidase